MPPCRLEDHLPARGGPASSTYRRSAGPRDRGEESTRIVEDRNVADGLGEESEVAHFSRS